MEQPNQQFTQEKTESKPPIKINWKFIAIVVVLGLVVGAGTIFFLRGFSPTKTAYTPSIVQQTPPSQPSPSPQALDTSTPALSGVEGWQTYRNSEFGFEVRYPRDWLVEENSTVLFLSTNDVTSRSNPDPHFHTFSMDIGIHNTNDTLEEFLKKRFNLKSLDEFKITPDESTYDIDWLKATTLGNDIQAYFIHEWVQAFSVCHFFVEHNDAIIEIARDGRYNCLDDPQFNQILSTFRFVE